MLVRLINWATNYINNECGRPSGFVQQTYVNDTYSIDNSGQSYLLLRNTPVFSLTSLQWRAGTPTNPSWTDFTPDQFELVDPRTDPISGTTFYPSGVVRVYGVLPRIYNNMIRATYVGGYPVNWANPEDHNTHWLPGDLTSVCENLVLRRFKRRMLAGQSIQAASKARPSAGATRSTPKTSTCSASIATSISDMDFQVTDPGLDAARRQTRRQAPQIAAPILQRALSASQAILAKYTTKGIVPWRTGFLAQTFQAQLTTGLLRWFPTASYAPYVEFGTKPHVIVPKDAKALFWPGAAHPGQKRQSPWHQTQPVHGADRRGRHRRKSTRRSATRLQQIVVRRSPPNNV